MIARRGGRVDSVDAGRIVVRVNDAETGRRTGRGYLQPDQVHPFQPEHLHQPAPLVHVDDIVARGDVLADGPSTDLGELALGQNLLVAFMPWNGYNFEDSILIPSGWCRKTASPPSTSRTVLCRPRHQAGARGDHRRYPQRRRKRAGAKLDEAGIVYIGAEVKAGDILVGKVTPKGETQLTPEEKLLRAIFGEKASDVKDTSLRVPSGMDGTVIDVRVFTRDGWKKDTRAQQIEELKTIRDRDLNDQMRILEDDLYQRMERMLDRSNGRRWTSWPAWRTRPSPRLSGAGRREQWFTSDASRGALNEQLERSAGNWIRTAQGFDQKFEEKRRKLQGDDDLPRRAQDGQGLPGGQTPRPAGRQDGRPSR